MAAILVDLDQRRAGNDEPLGMHQEMVTWLLRGKADGDLARECLGRHVWVHVQLIMFRNNTFWETETALPRSVVILGHTCREDSTLNICFPF